MNGLLFRRKYLKNITHFTFKNSSVLDLNKKKNIVSGEGKSELCYTGTFSVSATFGMCA